MTSSLVKVFSTLAEAQKRVDTLKSHGIWPGIRCHQDGTYTLTFNPSISEGIGTGRAPATRAGDGL